MFPMCGCGCDNDYDNDDDDFMLLFFFFLATTVYMYNVQLYIVYSIVHTVYVGAATVNIRICYTVHTVQCTPIKYLTTL